MTFQVSPSDRLVHHIIRPKRVRFTTACSFTFNCFPLTSRQRSYFRLQRLWLPLTRTFTSLDACPHERTAAPLELWYIFHCIPRPPLRCDLGYRIASLRDSAADPSRSTNKNPLKTVYAVPWGLWDVVECIPRPPLRCDQGYRIASLRDSAAEASSDLI